MFLECHNSVCSKHVTWQMLRRKPYCVKPELDNGSVIEFTDLRPNGNASLLFVRILLITLSRTRVCICVLENRTAHSKQVAKWEMHSI